MPEPDPPRLLERVADAAEELRRVEHELDGARDRFAEVARLAYVEGVPLARIATAAKFSRNRVRVLLRGR